jgi:hypothetical protein
MLVAAGLAFLESRFTPRTVFMDIGAPDCGFALRAARCVERVYAVDVSGHFIQTLSPPLNLRLVLCDGVRIPVPSASVELAWGGEFMEHLHPDDLDEHLKSVRRILAPGGEYLFRRCSPMLRRRILQHGFGAVRCYVGGMRLPAALAALLPSRLLTFGASR